MVVEELRQLRLRAVVVEVLAAVDVVLAGPSADTQFDGFDPDFLEVRGRVVDRFATQGNREHADVHGQK